MCLGCVLLKNYISMLLKSGKSDRIVSCTQLSELFFYNCRDVTILCEIPHTLSKLSFYNCPNLIKIPNVSPGVQVSIEKCPNVKISS